MNEKGTNFCSGGRMDCATASYAGVASSSPTEKEQKFVPFSFIHNPPLSLFKIVKIYFINQYLLDASRLQPARIRKVAGSSPVKGTKICCIFRCSSHSNFIEETFVREAIERFSSMIFYYWDFALVQFLYLSASLLFYFGRFILKSLPKKRCTYNERRNLPHFLEYLKAERNTSFK